jgi:hypothetical protein
LKKTPWVDDSRLHDDFLQKKKQNGKSFNKSIIIIIKANACYSRVIALHSIQEELDYHLIVM